MLKFDVCVWARQDGFGIRPVCSVEETISLLEEWPLDARSPLYYVAANSAAEGMQGSIAPDSVRAALLEFLVEAGALADEKTAH